MEITGHDPLTNLIVILVLIITPIILLHLAEKYAERSRHKEMIYALFTACCCATILAFFILATLISLLAKATDIRLQKLEKSVILKAETKKTELEENK